MPSSDPVGDMLCMIRNALSLRRRRVGAPHSRLKEGVARVLLAEGYLEDVRVVSDEKRPVGKTLWLYLKYDAEGEPVITRIERVSTPGRRFFRGVRRIDKVLDGLGIAVLSTSKGILSDRQARRERVGGELVCRVW